MKMILIVLKQYGNRLQEKRGFSMKLFIVPNNDGESREIQKLLTISHHRYLVTSQKWGAS